jgi:hypothetical protein
MLASVSSQQFESQSSRVGESPQSNQMIQSDRITL